MVRLAKAADVLPITLIARLTLEDAYHELLSDYASSKFIEDFYNTTIIEGLVEAGNMLVVENEEGLSVGFLSFKVVDSECEIVSLYILPRFQKEGYGSKLLAALYEHTKAKEYFTDIESRNIPIQKFYAQHGYIHETSYPQDLYGQPLKITRLRKA